MKGSNRIPMRSRFRYRNTKYNDSFFVSCLHASLLPPQGIKKAGGGQQELPDAARTEILELATRVVQENGGGGVGEAVSGPPRRPFSLKFQSDPSKDAVKTPQEALGTEILSVNYIKGLFSV